MLIFKQEKWDVKSYTIDNSLVFYDWIDNFYFFDANYIRLLHCHWNFDPKGKQEVLTLVPKIESMNKSKCIKQIKFSNWKYSVLLKSK